MNKTFKDITVYIASVDDFSRSEIENCDLSVLDNDDRVEKYSLNEFQDMINDEVYQTGDWVRIG